MSMTVREIVSEAQQLSREQISELLDLLLAERFSQPDQEIDAAWREETRRRVAQIQSGAVKGIPSDHVMGELRQITGL